MIRLNVSEQQLFDMIMAVYSLGNGEDGHHDPETARRREALLEKLHQAPAPIQLRLRSFVKIRTELCEGSQLSILG